MVLSTVLLKNYFPTIEWVKTLEALSESHTKREVRNCAVEVLTCRSNRNLTYSVRPSACPAPTCVPFFMPNRGQRVNRVRTPRTAVILSGGEGLRLRPITHDIPKGLVKVDGKPLLEWVVEWLQQNRVTDLVIGVAYLKEKIMRYFGNGGKFGVDIKYSVHTVEGGTSEGFRLAISRYVDSHSFFALNGDQITDLRLDKIYNTHMKNSCLASIGVVHPRLPFGLVDINQKGFCEGFVEKPVLNDVFISMGVYVFDRKLLKYLPRRGDVERTTFPKLAKMNKLKAFKHDGSFITVNSLRELEEADESLKERRSK